MSVAKLVFPGMLLLHALLAGCNEPRHADERVDFRVGNVEQTARGLVRIEAKRPANLETAGLWIEKNFAEDVEATNDMPRRVGEYLQRNVDRWIENQPAYQREIERFLRGRPEAIERNAITLFF